MILNINNTPVQIDDEDIEKISEYHWYIGAKGYVYGYIKGKSNTQYRMHRIIMGLGSKDQIVDHINGIRTDNRKQNLRIGTPKINSINRRNTPNGKYRGVYKDKSRNSWMIQVRCNGRAYGGGRYKNKDDAARAVELLRRKVFGKDYPEMNF